MLHFAHALLAREFFVYGEVTHPRGDNVKHIDLLGIASQGDWFVACEAKRFIEEGTLTGVLEDLGRLETFWLNKRLSPKCGHRARQIARECAHGCGLVLGLCWTPANQKLVDFWTTRMPANSGGEPPLLRSFRQELADLDAVWKDPIRVEPSMESGTYYLLSAFFQIRDSG